MPLIPKIAGATSLISTINDIHKTGVIYSKQEKNKAMGNNVLSCSIGNQKADYVSFKDAKRKNWSEKYLFFSGLKEDFASVKGYFKGIGEGIVRYIPKLILAAGAIIPKNKTVDLKDGTKQLSKISKFAYISAIGLAIYEAWDYLRYGTELFEKKDYLERK